MEEHDWMGEFSLLDADARRWARTAYVAMAAAAAFVVGVLWTL